MLMSSLGDKVFSIADITFLALESSDNNAATPLLLISLSLKPLVSTVCLSLANLKRPEIS